jgi:hypothetical protein
MTRRSKQRKAGPTWPNVLVIFAVIAAAFAAVAGLFGVQEKWSKQSAYAPVTGDKTPDDRTRDAIHRRIALLLKPRGGRGRTIEAALLHGRLARLEERHGRTQASQEAMRDAVFLLKSVNHANATEEHVRETVLAQDRYRKE